MYDELMVFFQKKLLTLKNVDATSFESDDLYDIGQHDLIEEITVFLEVLKENKTQ